MVGAFAPFIKGNKMKKLFLLILFAGILHAQAFEQAYSSIVSHGNGANSTKWVREFVFADSGATRIGAFSCDQPPIGIAITRNAVWDSITATTSDDYHWDSSWTASDFSFLFGFESILNDSARAVFTSTGTYDFLPYFESDSATSRYIVQADSMRYIELPQVKMAGAKYFFVEFYDAVGDSLVPQTAPRTFVLFYRSY